MAQLIICDRCGKPVEGTACVVDVVFPEPESWMGPKPETHRHLDLCADCWTIVESSLQGTQEEQSQPEASPTPSTD